MESTKIVSDFLHLLPVTAMPEYLQSFNSCVDYGYIIEGNCVLPYAKRKRSIFYFIQLSSGVLGAENEVEEKLFLNNALSFFKKNVSADYLISTNTSIFNSYPTGSLYCKFGSYVVDLHMSEEELFSGLHSKHRNVIRKAEKEGLVVSHGKKYLVDCYNLINETFSRQGMQSPTLENIQKLNDLQDNVSFTVVKVGNEIHGCAIFIWNKNHSCYYLHGGSIKLPHSGAMNLLHWETILRMKKNNVNSYDFVGARLNPDSGSRLEGIQRFKLRFGGELKVGYLWKFTFNNFKYKIYSVLLSVYFKYILKTKFDGDVIDQERKKGNF